jgi:hypothetical protein
MNLSKDAGILCGILAARLRCNPDELAVQTLAWSIVASWIAAVHYWIAHPDSDLFAALETAMKSVALSAETAWRKPNMP